jgi:hypothetical protein
MKLLPIVVGVVVALAPLVARGDDKEWKRREAEKELGGALFGAWEFDKEMKVWRTGGAGMSDERPDPCAAALKTLDELGTPGSHAWEIRNDSRDLKAGMHTLDEVRAACAPLYRLYWIYKFENRAKDSAQRRSENAAKICIERYQLGLQKGMKPSDRVVDGTVEIDSKKVPWTGTVEELRVKHCDNVMKEVGAERAKEEAPYRAVLKNDKLEMALGRSADITLIGGENTLDPKKLAAASVWFDALSETRGNESCTNGNPKKTLRRYTFDKQHKLVKQTEKDYCTDIPVSAFR